MNMMTVTFSMPMIIVMVIMIQPDLYSMMTVMIDCGNDHCEEDDDYDYDDH